mmetsp:Transcript_73715/g.175509  ORF Transcript_73715/g.175509 Transcript_73715/m.175509 type:complete len:281 (-) Transcript_73715:992-1834(-)
MRREELMPRSASVAKLCSRSLKRAIPKAISTRARSKGSGPTLKSCFRNPSDGAKVAPAGLPKASKSASSSTVAARRRFIRVSNTSCDSSSSTVSAPPAVAPSPLLPSTHSSWDAALTPRRCSCACAKSAASAWFCDRQRAAGNCDADLDRRMLFPLLPLRMNDDCKVCSDSVAGPSFAPSITCCQTEPSNRATCRIGCQFTTLSGRHSGPGFRPVQSGTPRLAPKDAARLGGRFTGGGGRLRGRPRDTSEADAPSLTRVTASCGGGCCSEHASPELLALA